jgi:hypothetical protein
MSNRRKMQFLIQFWDMQKRGGIWTSLRESLENGFKAVQEETRNQFENAKEAFTNFKPHQLEKKLAEERLNVNNKIIK